MSTAEWASSGVAHATASVTVLAASRAASSRRTGPCRANASICRRVTSEQLPLRITTGPSPGGFQSAISRLPAARPQQRGQGSRQPG